jgi:hypothetical protein
LKEYSSGYQLPLGSLDRNLLRVSINNPLADGFVLHDSLWGAGKQVLYPSQDPLNFAQTQTTVKDLQWFRRNSVDGGVSGQTNSTIETSPVVLLDDNPTATWIGYHATLSNDAEQKQTGTNCLKIVNQDNSALANYDPLPAGIRNWTAYDVLNVRIYGTNSGQAFSIYLLAGDWSNYYQFSTVDNFSGWKSFSVLLRTMTVTGSPTLSNIFAIYIGYPNPADTTWYLDCMIVDVAPSIPVKLLTIDGLYLENQLEESPDPTDVLEIVDDNQTAFWTSGTGVTLTNETTIKVKGINSAKIICDTVGEWASILLKIYSGYQDWSAYDFISFYWYGANSGKTFVIFVNCDGVLMYFVFVDNFSGQKRFVVPIRTFNNFSSVDMTKVNAIYLQQRSGSAISGTWYLDRMVLQKGRFAFVEVAVPDTLYKFQYILNDGSADNFDYSFWTLGLWDGSIYGGYNSVHTNEGINGLCFETTSNIITAISLMYPLTKVADFKTMYGDIYNWQSDKSFSSFVSGLKGQTKTRKSVFMANQSITYNGVGGTKRRIGFAIKMPPSDLTADATHGINQVKLKLDVYVP